MLKDISNYIKYRIDRMLNKGLFYQLMLLVFAIIILLLIVSIFIIVFFKYPPKDAFWDSLMQFIDTGNISSVEGDTGVVITFLMVTFVGVCGWGSLIAMINKALQDRINNLSKGNAFIMEKNHAIILGYGEEALTIIEEFIKAKVKTIVILSEHNVDVIRKRVSFIKGYKKTNIIIREGTTSRIENIKLLNISKSSSISIINNDDTESLNILLALKKIIEEIEEDKIDKKINICVLVHEEDTIEIIKSIENKNFVIHVIYKYEILYKLIAQSIIYTGLSNVYEDLFSNDGNIFYIENDHDFDNWKFEDAASKYFDKGMILLGITKEDRSQILIPNYDYIIKKENRLIILSKNNYDNPIKEYPDIKPNIIKYKNNILLICEEKRYTEIIKEISEYIENNNITMLSYDLIKSQKNKYKFMLEKLKKENTTKIVLISEDNITDVKSINILLIIREIIKKEKLNIAILSLLNSIQKRNLIYSDDVRDFIVSGKLIGMLMAQASISSNILYIFYGLLSRNGKDIIMSPYSDYFNESKSFKDVYFILLKKKIILIGIKRYNDIILNPNSECMLDNKDEIVIITNYVLEEENEELIF
ncbi:CASTOR/POLLUX-related putative ion channel [Brachyspira hyodysenteriae]|uniref:CASTOR/POLLUX-related putative ion channel n=1 Tax=Brachyspira hyodysenteriae TaxID=159 RepID=UPI003A80E458